MTMNRLLVAWTAQPCYMITMDAAMNKCVTSVPLRYAEPLGVAGARVPLRDFPPTMNFLSWTDVHSSLPYPGVVGTACGITRDSGTNIARIGIIHLLTSGLAYVRMSRIASGTEKKVVAMIDCSPTSEIISPASLAAATAAAAASASTTSAPLSPHSTAMNAAIAAAATTASSSAVDETIESTIPGSSGSTSSTSSTSTMIQLAQPSIMVLHDNGALLQFGVAPVEPPAPDQFGM
jgi:hypothetical protein